MIRPLLPFLLTALLSAAGCQNQAPQQNGEATGETASAEAPAGPSGALSPTRWLGDIPVYEDFAAMEPLFHKQTDTTYVINFWAT